MMTRRLDQVMMLLAIGLPATSQAIGLGDIKVQSALNEPLVAQIDIVGASAEELSSLSASVANLDTFLRYGAERPAFLSSASFRVSHDAFGRPVLLVKSREAFTEPLVSFLVEVRSTSGEIVREYTLLLDPATRADYAPVRAADQPRTTADAATTQSATADPGRAMTTHGATADPGRAMTTHGATADPGGTPQLTYTVAAHDTLDSIARRVGGATRNNLRRMVLAIYRGNPAAFNGNINRLHEGAILEMPAPTLVASITRADANRDFDAQMAAWHGSAGALLAAATAKHNAAHPSQAPQSLDKTIDSPTAMTGTPATGSPATGTPATGSPATGTPAVGPSAVGPSAGSAMPPGSVPASTPLPPAAVARATATADDALDQRLRSVESALEDTKRLQASEHAELLTLRQRLDAGSGPTAAEQDALPAAAAAASGTASARAATSAAATATPETSAPRAADPKPAATSPRHPRLIVLALAFGALALGSLVAWRLALRRRVEDDDAATLDEDSIHPEDSWSSADEQQTLKTLGIIEHVGANPVAREAPPAGALSPTAAAAPVPAPMAAAIAPPGLPYDPTDINTASLLALPEMADPKPAAANDTTVILAEKNIDDDYIQVDLDSTETHVRLPSGLNDHTVFTERRMNPADVLRQAIARQPDRNDLKIKLLEMYYDATASNRQAFLEVARKLALELDSASDEEWAKIMDMGKAIAADDSLFADSTGNTQTQPHQAINR